MNSSNVPKGILQKRYDRSLKLRTWENTIATIASMGVTMPSAPIPQPTILSDAPEVDVEVSATPVAEQKPVAKKKVVTRKKK